VIQPRLEYKNIRNLVQNAVVIWS